MGKQYTYAELAMLPDMIREEANEESKPKCKKGHIGHIISLGAGYICNKRMRAFSKEEVERGICSGCE